MLFKFQAYLIRRFHLHTLMNRYIYIRYHHLHTVLHSNMAPDHIHRNHCHNYFPHNQEHIDICSCLLGLHKFRRSDMVRRLSRQCLQTLALVCDKKNIVLRISYFYDPKSKKTGEHENALLLLWSTIGGQSKVITDMHASLRNYR